MLVEVKYLRKYTNQVVSRFSGTITFVFLWHRNITSIYQWPETKICVPTNSKVTTLKSKLRTHIRIFSYFIRLQIRLGLQTHPSSSFLWDSISSWSRTPLDWNDSTCSWIRRRKLLLPPEAERPVWHVRRKNVCVLCYQLKICGM